MKYYITLYYIELHFIGIYVICIFELAVAEAVGVALQAAVSGKKASKYKNNVVAAM